MGACNVFVFASSLCIGEYVHVHLKCEMMKEKNGSKYLFNNNKTTLLIGTYQIQKKIYSTFLHW